jgi:2-hydroxychromene-2-carboxylate isomerase
MTNGPKAPKIQRLKQLIDFVYNQQSETTEKTAIALYADIYDALEWLHTMLENRSLYHKKRNIKQRILIAMAKEQGLEDQANALTKTALHDYVSSQEPDDDDEFEIEQDDDTNE